MFHALLRRILERTLFHCNNIHIQRRGASDKHIINNCQSFTDKVSQFISLLLSDFVNIWKLSGFAVIIFNKLGEMWITGQNLLLEWFLSTIGITWVPAQELALLGNTTFTLNPSWKTFTVFGQYYSYLCIWNHHTRNSFKKRISKYIN